MIRRATPDDIPAIVAMGRRFHAASGMAMGFDEAAVSQFAGGLIQGGGVFIGESGMIGGALISAYCDPSWRIAVELAWWAERDGLALLRAFEDWAREVGAHEVRMTSLASLPRADVILRRKGYAATEISYQKVI